MAAAARNNGQFSAGNPKKGKPASPDARASGGSMFGALRNALPFGRASDRKAGPDTARHSMSILQPLSFSGDAHEPEQKSSFLEVVSFSSNTPRKASKSPAKPQRHKRKRKPKKRRAKRRPARRALRAVAAPPKSVRITSRSARPPARKSKARASIRARHAKRMRRGTTPRTELTDEARELIAQAAKSQPRGFSLSHFLASLLPFLTTKLGETLKRTKKLSADMEKNKQRTEALTKKLEKTEKDTKHILGSLPPAAPGTVQKPDAPAQPIAPPAAPAASLTPPAPKPADNLDSLVASLGEKPADAAGEAKKQEEAKLAEKAAKEAAKLEEARKQAEASAAEKAAKEAAKAEAERKKEEERQAREAAKAAEAARKEQERLEKEAAAAAELERKKALKTAPSGGRILPAAAEKPHIVIDDTEQAKREIAENMRKEREEQEAVQKAALEEMKKRESASSAPLVGTGKLLQAKKIGDKTMPLLVPVKQESILSSLLAKFSRGAKPDTPLTPEEQRKKKEEQKRRTDEKREDAQRAAPTVIKPVERQQFKNSAMAEFIGSIKYFGMGKERHTIIQNLATMLNAGLPLVDSLKTLQMEIRAKPAKKLVQRIIDGVENGSTLWRAMESQHFFSPHAIALVRIGEEAGNLAENMQYLAAQQEKDAELRAKVKMAMIYPVIVLSLMFIIVMGLGMFVLPNLIQVLFSLNVELPFVTRMVIAFTNGFTEHGTTVIPSIFGGIFFLVILTKFTNFKIVVQWILFRIPGIGQLAKEATLARFGVILGGLLQAGVPLVEAMRSLAEVTPIVAYRKFYFKLLEHINVGDSFAKSFTLIKGSEKILPISVQQLVITGERTGTLAKIMLKIADIYEKKANDTAQKLPVILEPMLLLFIGALVGTIAFAIIIPIYSIVGNVGH